VIRWVCEEHPDQPMGHELPDGSRCEGAGMPDMNPDAVRAREHVGVVDPVEDEEEDA
jgi:hypothetical protein